MKLGVKAPVPPAQGMPSTYGGTASASAMSSIGRTVFILLSALLRKPWAELSADGRLPSALFFFGSKRAWIFPTTDAARQESAANNPQYLKMDQRLRECILRKEEDGLVFWLKPDGLVYDGGLYIGDPGAPTLARPNGCRVSRTLRRARPTARFCSIRRGGGAELRAAASTQTALSTRNTQRTS